MRGLLSRLAALVLLYAVVVSAWAYLDGPGKGSLGTLPVTIPPIDFDKWVRTPAIWAAWIGGVVLVVRIVYVAKRPHLHRFGTAKWNEALEAAGLIRDPAGKNADPAPRARMVGKIRVIDETTLITLRLPNGLTVPQVAAKAEQVAGVIDVPITRLHLSKLDGRSSMLRVRIDPPDRPLKPRDVELPEVTTWRDPVLVGRDMRGRDITAPVYDIGQWLVGGITGSGKTTLLRLIAAHYALDPDATIWGCDGKGSTDDWGPLHHRVTRWVDVTDPDASLRYIDMLRDIGNEVAARNKAGGRDHPGMLVILEEATALRAGLDNAETTESDKLLVRIVQTCRSANVLVVTAAQRPSASLMSSNVRAQAGVGVCMRVRSMSDAEMVLGYRPEVALPEAVGRALLDVGDGTPRAVLVDHMPYGAWMDLCEQWKPQLHLVPPVEEEPEPELEPEPEDAVFEDEPVSESVPTVDPLLAAVWVALKASGRRMTTSELWEALPREVRTSDPVMLGRTLTKLGVQGVRGSRGTMYSLDLLNQAVV